MTKSELIQALAEKTDLLSPRAEAVVNAVFDAMADALRRGERIEVRGFGVFEVRQYRGYRGRNPRTGEITTVAPKQLPFFKAGKELRERVAGGPAGEAERGEAAGGEAAGGANESEAARESRKFDPERARFLNAPERQRAIPPERVAALASVAPGATVADLGSGTGYFLWPVVDATDGRGIYYAVDSSDRMLDALREAASRHPHGHLVQPVLSTDETIPLPRGSVDVAVLGSVYHELPDRVAYMRRVFDILRPGGRALVIDWRPLPAGVERTVGPPAHHRISEEEATREMTRAGFDVEARPGAFDHLWALVAYRRA